ncbi:13875_t:CDS:2 [Racocetra persica]|uniref:13875_t:CDS:1 n=1 Tax=Racocetra persica TaxID=160502 RepID=A0ACA9MFU7_9GLOM|nr:13875_t:CDS:2 [Racocetra persica]
MEKEAEAPVASTSETSETSKMSNLPEPKIVERSQKDQLETSKLPEPIELISGVVPDTPSKETDSSKPINEASSSSQTIEMNSMLAEIDAMLAEIQK